MVSRVDVGTLGILCSPFLVSPPCDMETETHGKLDMVLIRPLRNPALESGQLFCQLKGFPSNSVLSNCLLPCHFYDKYIWKVTQPFLKIEATWSVKRNGPRKWKYTGESDVTSIYIRFIWLDASMPACIRVRPAGRRVLGHLPQAQEGISMFTPWRVWPSLRHKIMNDCGLKSFQ